MPPDDPIHDALYEDSRGWSGETDSRQDGEALARLILADFRRGDTLISVDLAGSESLSLDFAMRFADTLCAEPSWMAERFVRFRNVEGCANWTLLREQLDRYAIEEMEETAGGKPRGLTGCACPALAAERLRARRASDRKARKDGEA